MRVRIYDTQNNLRDLEVVNEGRSDDESLLYLRAHLSEFKTHCYTEGTRYEFNNFMNWLKKYKDYGVTSYKSVPFGRVDM